MVVQPIEVLQKEDSMDNTEEEDTEDRARSTEDAYIKAFSATVGKCNNQRTKEDIKHEDVVEYIYQVPISGL